MMKAKQQTFKKLVVTGKNHVKKTNPKIRSGLNYGGSNQGIIIKDGKIINGMNN